MGVYFCSPTTCNNLVPLGSPPRLGVPTSAKSDNRPRLQQSANRSSASYPLFPGLTGGKGKKKKKGSPFPLTLFQLRRELRTHTSTPIHLFILPPHRHLDHHLQRREKNKNKSYQQSSRLPSFSQSSAPSLPATEDLLFYSAIILLDYF